jgi:hypothetical protein
MKHATGTIRGGHNPKRPYRATAAEPALHTSEMPDRTPRRNGLRRRRLGRSRRYNDLRRSSRLHSCRSVLGLTLLRHQSLQPHAPGSSPQHVRSRRQGFLAQKRNDPNKSHCARRIKSLRTRNGRASHSSSVSRPGKLRVPTGRRRAMAWSPLFVTTGLDPVVHAEWPPAIWPNACSAKLHGSPGQARR